MQINQGFAASGRGYVRAVFSRRMRGYALPVELVRVHLRALRMIETPRSKRLRAAFAGYLVSESDIAAFSESRKKYAPRIIGVVRTGFAYVDCVGGDIDAPGWILAGAMGWVDGAGVWPVCVMRGKA